MRITPVFIMVGSLMAGTAAFAQQQPGYSGMGGPGMGGSGEMMGRQEGQQGMMGQYGYRSIDRNADGFISKEEVALHQQLLERMQANWAQADRNGDGHVDAVEFSAFEQSMR